ncbi:hypothetical protein ACFRH9_17730 [Peribacillus butanolivorans]|uniref:hypothetical protein n=1 Tax=Peribacillus butanolivorans TaxID=421767 RepID=UPI0036729533
MKGFSTQLTKELMEVKNDDTPEFMVKRIMIPYRDGHAEEKYGSVKGKTSFWLKNQI